MAPKSLTPKSRAERQRRALIAGAVALFVMATAAAALTGGRDFPTDAPSSANATLDAMLGVLPGALPGASPRIAPNTVRGMVMASRALDAGGGGGTAPIPGSAASQRGDTTAAGARDSAKTRRASADSAAPPATDAATPVAPLQIRIVQNDRPYACSTKLDLDGMAAAILQRDMVEMRRYVAPVGRCIRVPNGLRVVVQEVLDSDVRVQTERDGGQMWMLRTMLER